MPGWIDRDPVTPPSAAPAAQQERALAVVNRIIEKAQKPDPNLPPPDMVNPWFGFASGAVGTALTTTVTPMGGRIDFPMRLTGVFLDEISLTPISGNATVAIDWKPAGGSWQTIGSISMTSATSASDETLTGWIRWFQPGDMLRGRVTAASTVQAIVATLRCVKLAETVEPTLGLRTSSGDTLVTSSGDRLVVLR